MSPCIPGNWQGAQGASVQNEGWACLSTQKKFHEDPINIRDGQAIFMF